MRTHRARKKLPNWAVGLILVVVVGASSFLAYTKKLPWSHTFTVHAVFTTSQNINVNSPVRIAGVNVGKVTSIEHLTSSDPGFADATSGANGRPNGQQATVVDMEIQDQGLPLHSDATMKLRPRLFLEGNLFVDLHPGTPESSSVDDGYTFPESQTSVSVQLDQVLSTLQADVRANLQVFLNQLGNAFIKYGGAARHGATRPLEPGEEPRLHRRRARPQRERAAGARHQLPDRYRLLRRPGHGAREGRVRASRPPRRGEAGAHRAQQLVPAGAGLRGRGPAWRALDAATPLLRQLRGLVSKPELRGLTHDLRPTIPDLTKLTKRTIPFLHQTRSLSSCFNQVIIPWSNSHVTDPDFPTPKIYQETSYGLEGIAGESRTGDGNGQYVRVEGASGPDAVQTTDSETGNALFGLDTPLGLNGGRPAISSSAKPPYRPDVPCETQQPPNLNSGGISSGPSPAKAGPATATPADQELMTKIAKAADLQKQGKKNAVTKLVGKAFAAWQKQTKAGG
jgi:hypothetical protein